MTKYNTKNSSKQDLIAAREQLKQFRHDVAQLKKKGLIDKAYDARSVSPTRYLKSQIKKFGAVLEGTATPVKVSKKNAKIYREKGFAVKNSRVVIPHAANEKVYASHGDYRIKAEGKGGSITRIAWALPTDDIAKWKEAIAEKHPKLGKGEQLTFQFFGNNSYRSFFRIQDMLDYLEFYNSFEEAVNSNDPNVHRELIDNIVIYKIERNAQLPPPPPPSPEIIEARRAKARERYQRYQEHLTDEQRHANSVRRRENNRIQQERARERMKKDSDPEKLLQYREKAKARAAKSRKKMKGE